MLPSTCNPRIFSIPPASGQRSSGSHLLPTLWLPNSKSVMHAGIRQNSSLAFTTLNQRTSYLLAFVICDMVSKTIIQRWGVSLRTNNDMIYALMLLRPFETFPRLRQLSESECGKVLWNCLLRSLKSRCSMFPCWDNITQNITLDDIPFLLL